MDCVGIKNYQHSKEKQMLYLNKTEKKKILNCQDWYPKSILYICEFVSVLWIAILKEREKERGNKRKKERKRERKREWKKEREKGKRKE